MAPEGVVHALKRIHAVLVPGGILLDLHPAPPNATAESGGRSLGAFDEREFMQVVAATEAGLEETVGRGLFAPDREIRFDVLERFEDAAELLETVASWEGFRVPPVLSRRVRSARPPIDIRERVVLRRLRTVRKPRSAARTRR
jgi:hypothetical protein